MHIDEPGQLILRCEWHISPLGLSYFMNHNTGITSWMKPIPERHQENVILPFLDLFTNRELYVQIWHL